MFGRQLKCSFCEKRHDEVAKLVSGRRAYICGDCIAIASEVVRVSGSPRAPFTPGRGASTWSILVNRFREFIQQSRRQAFAVRPGPPAAT
jgi:ATP-dependent protease Clp ATPase subunit